MTVKRRVTNHALLRYLERVVGLDLESHRNEIRALCDQASEFKNCDGLWHQSGVVLITNESGDVVTVLGSDEAKKYAGRRLVSGERSTSADQSQ
jgi:hypothetical protein